MCGFCSLLLAAACAHAQTPQASQPMNSTPSQPNQLPLSGRQVQVQPVVIQQQPSPQAGNGSVVVNNTTVTVQGPYAGSVSSGRGSGELLRLTLQQALAMGLRANLGALGQSAALEQAQGQRLAARSQLLPQLNAGVSESFEKVNLRTVGVDSPMIPEATKFNFYDARVRLNQSVLDFTRIRNFHGATENVKANIAAARNARDLIVLAVGGSYLQMVASQARGEAAASEVESERAVYTQAEDRFDAGLTARIDVSRAQVQLQTDQQRLRALQAELDSEKLRLARLIGLPLDQVYVPADDYAFDPELPLTEAAALERAQSQRPDFQAASAAMRAAQLAVKAASAEHLPTLAVNGDFGADGTTPTKHSLGVFDVTGSLNIPIYEGGRIHADEQQANAALRQRKAELEDTRGQIEQDVRQAFIDLRSAADQVFVAQSNVQLAHETLKQSTDRFLVGVTDTVEVVQSEQAVVQADDDYINARFEHNLAKVSLARAMGNAEQSLPQLLRIH